MGGARLRPRQLQELRAVLLLRAQQVGLGLGGGEEGAEEAALRRRRLLVRLDQLTEGALLSSPGDRARNRDGGRRRASFAARAAAATIVSAVAAALAAAAAAASGLAPRSAVWAAGSGGLAQPSTFAASSRAPPISRRVVSFGAAVGKERFEAGDGDEEGAGDDIRDAFEAEGRPPPRALRHRTGRGLLRRNERLEEHRERVADVVEFTDCRRGGGKLKDETDGGGAYLAIARGRQRARCVDEHQSGLIAALWHALLCGEAAHRQTAGA